MKKLILTIAKAEFVPEVAENKKFKAQAPVPAHYKVTLKNGQSFTLTVDEYKKSVFNG